MGKFFTGKVSGYFLYFTSHDKDEPIHAHASDRKLLEAGSAKIWLLKDGSTEVAHKGQLTDRELSTVCSFIEKNHMEMFRKWENHFGILTIKGEPGVTFTVDDGKLKPISFADMIKNKK